MPKKGVSYKKKHIIELTDEALDKLKDLFETGDRLADELIAKQPEMSNKERIMLSEQWDKLVTPFREILEEND